MKEEDNPVWGMLQFEVGEENNFEVSEKMCVIYPRINAKDIHLFYVVEKC